MKKPNEYEIEMQDLKPSVVSDDDIPTIEISDDQGQKRLVALMDNDHTLADSDAEGRIVLNRKLLNALKAKGIKDLYLFTDMLLLPSQIKDRLHIIEELKREGFTVHGVITPIDYFWTSDPEMLKILERFDEAMRKANISFKKNATKNLEKLPDVLAQFPEITERIHSDPNVGHAFNEGAKAYLRGNDIDPLTRRSIACKAAIDVISFLRKFESCKGVMCQQFLAHLPEWVSACFVFEDNADHITALKQCVSPKIPLFAIEGLYTLKGGDTFVANFARYLVNTSYAESDLNPAPTPAPISQGPSIAARMRDLASMALLKIKNLQQAGPFAGRRYKKEFTQAENLFAKIIACDNDFEKQWGCVSAHLKSLAKSFSGAYQLSVFDNHLLELLSSDALICAKVDALNKNQSMSVAFDMSQAADRQLFIQRWLGDAVHTVEKGPFRRLHLSMGTMPKLKSKHSSGPVSYLASSKKKSPTEGSPNPDNVAALTRARANSEGPMPSNRVLSPSNEGSSSEPSEHADSVDSFKNK